MPVPKKKTLAEEMAEDPLAAEEQHRADVREKIVPGLTKTDTGTPTPPTPATEAKKKGRFQAVTDLIMRRKKDGLAPSD